jgi:hypothetical protein
MIYRSIAMKRVSKYVSMEVDSWKPTRYGWCVHGYEYRWSTGISMDMDALYNRKPRSSCSSVQMRMEIRSDKKRDQVRIEIESSQNGASPRQSFIWSYLLWLWVIVKEWSINPIIQFKTCLISHAHKTWQLYRMRLFHVMWFVTLIPRNVSTNISLACAKAHTHAYTSLKEIKVPVWN